MTRDERDRTFVFLDGIECERVIEADVASGFVEQIDPSNIEQPIARRFGSVLILQEPPSRSVDPLIEPIGASDEAIDRARKLRQAVTRFTHDSQFHAIVTAIAQAGRVSITEEFVATIYDALAVERERTKTAVADTLRTLMGAAASGPYLSYIDRVIENLDNPLGADLHKG